MNTPTNSTGRSRRGDASPGSVELMDMKIPSAWDAEHEADIIPDGGGVSFLGMRPSRCCKSRGPAPLTMEGGQDAARGVQSCLSKLLTISTWNRSMTKS